MPDTSQLIKDGQASLEEFDILKAEELFRTALEQDPESPEAHLGMAKTFLLRAKPQEAKEWAQKAADLTEDKGDANAMIAVCLMDQDQVEDAIALLKRTNQWHPNNPLVLSNLGKALAMQGDYENAKKYSTLALEHGACKEEVEHDLGIIASGLHQFEEAVDHFVAAIEANPTYLPPYLRLSQFAKMLGMLDETIELLEDGVSMMPSMVHLREELHDLYIFKGDAERAMVEALELARQRGWPADYLRIGNTALLLGDIEGAQSAYETAIEIDPEDVGGHLNLAHLYRLMHKREEALEKYQFVGEKYPELYKPYLGLGLTYMEIDGDHRKARLCFLKAVELEPQSYDVLINLAKCSLELGELDEAHKFATVALGISETPREQERAEEILQSLKNPQQAQNKEENPSNP